MSDDELFLYFLELLEAQAMVSCGNVNCSYKVVELYTKCRPVVPEDYWEDKLYLKPPDKVPKDNRAKVKAIKEGGGGHE